MKVNNYPIKTPEIGDKLFGSDSSGDQAQFYLSDVSDFGPSRYVGLISQRGTSVPIIEILDNTIGDIVFSIDPEEPTGSFLATLTGAFTLDKTWVMVYPITTGKLQISRIDNDNLSILTYNSSGVLANGVLNDTPIEIRVYS